MAEVKGKPAATTPAPAKPEAAPQKGNGKKTACPVSLAAFAKGAKPVVVKIGDIPMVAVVKAPFSTGSFGWYLNGKTVIDVDGTPVEVQLGFNLTVIGSKEAAKE